MNKITPAQMVSVARCKTILEKDGSKYSTEEVLLIRDFLQMLAEQEFSVYVKEKRRNIEFEKLNNEQFDQAA